MDDLKQQSSGIALAEHLGEKGWTYIKTVVDTAHDPFLVLDKNMCVCAANKAYYDFFQVKPKDTENKFVRELGSGEWNIAALETLLETIIPNNSFFSGFEVDREFPIVGRKVVLLTGRRIYKVSETSAKFPPIILLAMVDITQMTVIAGELAEHVAQLEKNITERTDKLETDVTQLKKDIGNLR